jgi:hypothetical protein
MKMKDLVKFVIARGREPSTYAGLAAVLVALNVPDAASWAHDISAAAVGLFGITAMVMKDTGALN